jgi:dethiobiotin synthetase
VRPGSAGEGKRRRLFIFFSFVTIAGMSGKKIIFVTGTDTGVGKTLLTALLLQHLRESGCHALAMKPFCSGGRGDVKLLQSLQRGELSDEEVNPFYFRAPVAPLVELKKTRRNISLSEVVATIRHVEKKCERLLVEGSGGLMVPLGQGYLVEDLILKLKCQVTVVARNRLGTINHTLLTVARLRARGIKDANMRVALMNGPGKDISSKSNAKFLKGLLGEVEMVVLRDLGREKTVFKQAKSVLLQSKSLLKRLIR